MTTCVFLQTHYVLRARLQPSPKNKFNEVWVGSHTSSMVSWNTQHQKQKISYPIINREEDYCFTVSLLAAYS